ncbi:MAG: hypothetical protein K8R89_00790 [Anaerolineae bacterium]|nr:hypothetical protein [Anaerolineae bacterium]
MKNRCLLLFVITILFLWSSSSVLASDHWWVAGGYYVCSTQGNCDAHFTVFDEGGDPIGNYTIPAGESYLVPLNHSAYVSLSCGPSPCRPVWPAGHIIAPAAECPCDSEVTVYDSDEQQVDSFTVHAGDTYTVPADHTARECMVCGFCPPPPTPTPAPSAPQACNSIVLTETLSPESERWIDIQPCDTCIEATVECSSTAEVHVYGNGLFLGECGSVLTSFYTRGALSSTLTLLNTAAITTTAQLNITCDSVFGGQSDPLPTPTIWLIPTPTTNPYQGQGDPPLLGIDFGGDPADPNSPSGQWLGHGKSFIDMVNSGGLLYTFGGILSASMVLSWAIGQVKNPRDWSK